MPSQPRDWCSPREAFGRRSSDITARVWAPPPVHDLLLLSKFRAAVMQNVICVAVREYKFDHGIAQEVLSRTDQRADSANMWNARLCGRANLTMQDLATLIRHWPEAIPDAMNIERFLAVAEGRMAPPRYWPFPDTATALVVDPQP